MKHSDLVQIAARWLKNNRRCSVVLTELVCDSATNEIPDAIGFNSYGSFLVECKTSLSDYMADRNKIFRIMPEKGMGQYRFIICPENIIPAGKIYSGWGLLWANNNKIYPQNFKDCNIPSAMGLTRFTPRFDCERQLLVSALRRKNEKVKKSDIEIPYHKEAIMSP